MNGPPFPARVVLLDWDGTLLNSYAADVRVYLAMFRAMGIVWGVEDLERCYSPDWYQVYRAAQIPRPEWARADRFWRSAYAKERPRLLPGARGVVGALKKDYLLAIVTGGSRDRVRRQLRDFELADYFSACVYSENSLRKKPHPAPLNLALKQIGAKPDELRSIRDLPKNLRRRT